MFKKLCLILATFVLLSGSPCFGLETSGFEPKDYVTYFGTTDGELTVQWSLCGECVKYEIKLIHVEQDRTVALGETTQLDLKFKLDKSGHYIAYVRGVMINDEKTTWSQSTNPAVATVGGEPRAWWIYGHVKKPGPITFP